MTTAPRPASAVPAPARLNHRACPQREAGARTTDPIPTTERIRMLKKKTDLTSPKAVAKSQKVYGGIVTGQVKNAKKALKKAHGKG
jgi:hypothetical protein